MKRTQPNLDYRIYDLTSKWQLDKLLFCILASTVKANLCICNSISYTGNSLCKIALKYETAWSYYIFRLILIQLFIPWVSGNVTIWAFTFPSEGPIIRQKSLCDIVVSNLHKIFEGICKERAVKLIKTIHMDIHQSQILDSFEKCNIWNTVVWNLLHPQQWHLLMSIINIAYFYLS